MAAPKKHIDKLPPHPELGKRLRSVRQAKAKAFAGDAQSNPWRPTAFALSVRLSGSHLSRIEQGWVMPHKRKLAHLCNALGLVQHWVCSGKGRKYLREGELNAAEGC